MKKNRVKMMLSSSLIQEETNLDRHKPASLYCSLARLSNRSGDLNDWVDQMFRVS